MLDLFARETQKPGRDPSGSPAEPSSDVVGGSLIPAELALDRAEVVEPRLDLYDEQGAGSWIESDEVDPAVRSTVDDLDFPGREPPGPTKPSVDMTRTPSMDEIALVTADDDRRSCEELDLESQPDRDLFNDRERWIRASRFDLGDVSA